MAHYHPGAGREGVSPFTLARESPAVKGRAKSRAGNGTIIEPILMILEPYIYLVFR